MDKKMLIVLYGKQNQGKTSCLKELAKLLSGSYDDSSFNSKLSQAMKRSKGQPKDARFIIFYKGYYIFIATGGDDWRICRVNSEFFERKIGGNVNIWLIKEGNIKKLEKEEKDFYINITPKVCITSCRPNGDGYGAVKAINSYVEKTMEKVMSKSINDIEQSYERILWLRKFEGMNRVNSATIISNAKKKAQEIKDIIDDYLR
jgi:AAA+ ATPase superfamily predicted ATPase